MERLKILLTDDSEVKILKALVNSKMALHDELVDKKNIYRVSLEMIGEGPSDSQIANAVDLMSRMMIIQLDQVKVEIDSLMASLKQIDEGIMDETLY
jgi:hypothetical protein